MGRTDLVSDGLTMIRNASRVRKEEVLVPYSKVLKGIANILKEEGYIDNFKEVDLGKIKKIKMYLKYDGKKGTIRQIKKISKPGRRVYVDKANIPNVLSGYGVAVISTSRGVVSNKSAKELGVGGEVICYVW